MNILFVGDKKTTGGWGKKEVSRKTADEFVFKSYLQSRKSNNDCLKRKGNVHNRK
jgi:hypothetical protein